MATVIEIYVAIIGSCLPTLVPVYRRLRYGVPYKRQNSATHEGPSVDSKRSARTSKTPQRKQFANDEDTLVQLSQSDNAFTATAYSNSQLKSDSEPQNPESYQLDGVVVRRDMTWSENSHEHSIV